MSNATISVTIPGMQPGTVAPSCDEFFAEIAAMLTDISGASSGVVINMTSEERRHLAIGRFVKDVSPYICVFGIFGNILNLIVLTRKGLKCSMDHMEKSAQMGLVALAVSDMFFCLVYLLTLLIPKGTIYFSPYDWVFGLYFHTYKEGLVNVFVFSCTWLTVIMALGRYVAVCRPLHARGCINLRATRVSICAVFAASILINIPRFMHYQVQRFSCENLVKEENLTGPPEGIDCPCAFYHQNPGSLFENNTFVFYYNLAWSILAIIIPLIVLTVCNVCLIRALRHSYQIQKQCRANKPKDSGHAITPTLIALIIMFIVLVGPSGILTFFRDAVLDVKVSSSAYYNYMSALVFTNGFVLINFAVNFVLYCVVNAKFRKIATETLCCLWVVYRRRRPSRLGSVYSRTSRNTGTYNVSDVETEL